MYEIRCIIPDKRLDEFLRTISPLTLEPPVALPVDDDADEARPSLTKVPSGIRKPPRGNSAAKIQQIAELFNKGSKKQVTPDDLKNLMVKVGYMASSYGYAMKTLIANDVLRRTKVTGVYDVTKNVRPSHKAKKRSSKKHIAKKTNSANGHSAQKEA